MLVNSPSAESPIDATVDNLAKLRDEGLPQGLDGQMPFDGDLLTVLAVALREVDTIEVGSAVLPIQNQHPMQMAQRALTLNTIAGGRFILGLGMTHQAVTEGMWGIPYDKPVRRMREYLDGLQPLLAGEAADAVGETVTARGALQIAGAPTPEVYLAALGPQMLKLAGRRTAGTLTWMCGPKTLAEHIAPTLRAGGRGSGAPGERRSRGRRPPDQRHRRRRRCAGAGRRAVRDVRHLPSYRAMLDREGYAESRGRGHHRRREDGVRPARRVERRSVSTSSPPSSSTRPLRCAHAPAPCCFRRTPDRRKLPLV